MQQTPVKVLINALHTEGWLSQYNAATHQMTVVDFLLKVWVRAREYKYTLLLQIKEL